ncbi:hypothetical protein STEG23_001474 [Scotinomys teguina]
MYRSYKESDKKLKNSPICQKWKDLTSLNTINEMAIITQLYVESVSFHQHENFFKNDEKNETGNEESKIYQSRDELPLTQLYDSSTQFNGNKVVHQLLSPNLIPYSLE